MTFDELTAAVIIETGRPDLTIETAQAVRSNILAAHSIDYFSDDCVLIQYIPPVSGMSVNVTKKQLVTVSKYPSAEFRHAFSVSAGGSAYVNTDWYAPGASLAIPAPADSAYTNVTWDAIPLELLTIRTVRDVWNCTLAGYAKSVLDKQSASHAVSSSGVYADNVWRELGANINAYSSSGIDCLAISCLVYPDVTADNFRSWIADEVPYYIIHAAAAHVLGAVCGRADEANMQRQAAQIHLPQIMSHVMF